MIQTNESFIGEQGGRIFGDLMLINITLNGLCL